METVPFCYLIGWTKLDKFYYGVRYMQGATPDTLWKTYYTSSKYVKQFIEDNGEPDIIQVRKTFKCGILARKWETKVLQRLGAVKSTRWLNRNDTTNFYKASGWYHTDEVKQKISEIKKSQHRTNSAEVRKIISEANKNKIVTDETRKKMSEAAKKVKHTEEWLKNNGLARRKKIQIYSTLQDKNYYWLTTNIFKKDTGLSYLDLRQMKSKEGFTIKRRTKRAHHDFEIGDTLYFIIPSSSRDSILLN